MISLEKNNQSNIKDLLNRIKEVNMQIICSGIIKINRLKQKTLLTLIEEQKYKNLIVNCNLKPINNNKDN
jgi:hypothetical protein